MQNTEVCLLGGDARIYYFGKLLKEKGFTVSMGFEKGQRLHQSRIVVASVPLIQNGAAWIWTGAETDGETPKFAAKSISPTEFVKMLGPGQILVAGAVPDELKEICHKKDVTVIDLLTEEAFAIYNAIATAEGVILEALLKSEENLHKSRVLVWGFGRCAKVIADKCKGMGSYVTICARKEADLALADALGYETLSFKEATGDMGCEALASFHIMINTIPAVVLTETILRQTREDILILDIASKKGGVDYDAANKLNIRAFLCPSLPGKYAPKACAKGMTDIFMKYAKDLLE